MSTDERQSQEIEDLNEALRRLTIENKKLNRQLERGRQLIARNKVTTEAQNRLSDIVSTEKSRLEKHMDLLLGNSRDYILFFDNNSIIVSCTESFLRKTGVPGFGLLKGKTFREIMTLFLPAGVIRQVEDLQSQTGAGADANDTIEVQLQVDFDQDGISHDYILEASQMRGESGRTEGSLVFFYDVNEVTMAKREADRANAAKSDFLATMSHEIRTPMNAIIGISDMMADTELTDKQLSFLKKIQNSSVVMLDLINDILDFSKIEAGKLELIDEYFDFGELLQNLRAVFDLLMGQKKLAFSCAFAADLPRVVFGDAKRVRQVLTNILNNAYKYTREGSVSLEVSAPKAGFLRFDVKDTGVGIRSEELPKLFNEFEQLDVVKNKNITGTGLGLTITKRLCELMKGEISVTSVYGEGSTFSVLLPVTVGTEADLPEKIGAVMKFKAPGAKVLLVDDMEINLEIAAYMLEPYEVDIEMAEDGEQAVEMVQNGGYDLILMDQMMPKMNGVEATKLIREMPGDRGETPIVALTANAISGSEQMFLEAGFNGYLSKPVDEKALSAALYKFLPQDKIAKE